MPVVETAKELHALFSSGRAPEGLVVKGDLVLAGTRVRALPARLTVHGSLDLRRCERLHRLGAGLRVGRDLRIGGTCPDLPSASQRGFPAAWESRDAATPLAALPEDLEVRGSIELRHCARLQALPAGLRVGRSLVLVGCDALRALPAGLAVPEDLLILGGRALLALPACLSVGRDLRIAGTALTALPEGLTVGQRLHLSGMRRLAALGETAVGGDLIAHGYRGEALPAGLVVEGDLLLPQTRRLKATPADLRVGGSLTLSGAAALGALTPGLCVAGDLLARDCPRLVSLPEHLNVAGTLDLRGCTALTELPRGLGARRLLLADCSSLEVVPPDLRVTEPVEVAGTEIRRWPDELAKHWVRFRGVRVPPEVVFAPWTLDAARILGERNTELRRVMLERAGFDDVLKRARATTLDADRDPGGERRLLEVRLPGAARFLDCRCPSTGRRYLLGVPGPVGSCHAAAAWLAGFDDPRAYAPLQET